jgi:flagellin
VGLTFQTGATKDTTFDVNIGNSTAEDLEVAGSLDATTSDGQSVTGAEFSDPSAVTVASGTISNNGTVDTGGTASSLAGDLQGGEFDVTVERNGAGTSASLVFEGGGDTTTVTTASGGGSFTASATLTLSSDTSGNKIALNNKDLGIGTGDIADGATKEFTVEVRDSQNIGTRLEGSGGDEARSIIEDVDTAIDNLTSELSNLGASQNRLSFKESNLETSQSNLSAAQSRIEDADFAKEQTQVAKLQVQQQSGTAQLAQANAAGQSVLSLLGG